MQLSYRKLFTDANSVEYSVIKTTGTRCLCLQGDRKVLPRIKKAYKSAQFFYKATPDNIFEPISINENIEGNLVNALFTYKDAGFLKLSKSSLILSEFNCILRYISLLSFAFKAHFHSE